MDLANEYLEAESGFKEHQVFTDEQKLRLMGRSVELYENEPVKESKMFPLCFMENNIKKRVALPQNYLQILPWELFQYLHNFVK